MNARERTQLKKKIMKLIDKLFIHPRIDEKRDLGRSLCRYFDIDDVDGICGGLDIYEAIDSLYPGAINRKSLSTYKLCMRLSFACTASLAKKLDSSRVPWRNVVAALSTKLTIEENRDWLDKLALNPHITMKEIKASYGVGDEQNIRLPRNVEEGCERFRKYAFRLTGYAKGLQARMATRSSQRITADDEISSLSATELAARALNSEVQSLLQAVDQRRHVIAEQPLASIG